LTPIINMNYQSLVSSGDVHHTGIITTSRHGMPMGTGSMGSLVWSNNDHSLNFQINRVDVFGWNSLRQQDIHSLTITAVLLL